MKRVAIYLRVSTSKQDTENQLRELSAVADRSGWDIWKVYEDAGISGAKGRDKRPGLDAMMKAVNAKQFDLVATWSVDRFGRSLTDLLGILHELRDKGVHLFLHQQGFDTSTTAGKAMFQMLGVLLSSRGGFPERVNAGLARSALCTDLRTAIAGRHEPPAGILWPDLQTGCRINLRRHFRSPTGSPSCLSRRTARSCPAAA